MSTYTFTTIATGRISIDAGTFNAAPDSSQVVLTWDKGNRVSMSFLGITLNIDATKDTVVIDTTSHAPNFYTGNGLWSALVALFPKANSGSGGTGTADLSNYYTKPQANSTFQPAGSYLTASDVTPAIYQAKVQLWVEDYRATGDTDADVWDKALAAMDTQKMPLHVGNVPYSINRPLIFSGSYFHVVGVNNGTGGTSISNGTAVGFINSATTADTTYPTTSNPAVLSGCAFYFTANTYYLQLENIRFNNFRFAIAALTAQNSPTYKNLYFSDCNVGIIYYQGSQNVRLINCKASNTNTVYISSATCFPQSTPYASQDNYYTDGLHASNTDGYGSFSLVANDNFDAWFRDSILRPSVGSYSAGASNYVYPYADTSPYCLPSGWCFFLPMRNRRWLFGITLNNLDVRYGAPRGLALLNDGIMGLEVSNLSTEGMFNGVADTTIPMITLGTVNKGILSNVLDNISGSVDFGHAAYAYTGKGGAGQNLVVLNGANATYGTKAQQDTNTATITANTASIAINQTDIAKRAYSPNFEGENGLYLPVIKAAGLESSTGLADHASGGVVASVAGTSGTGAIYLPKPIDPTKPWRCAVLVEINDSQPIDNINFCDAAGDNWTGIRMNAISTTGISGVWAGTVQPFNNYGNTGGIPAGTKLWIGMSSDGISKVSWFIIPENPTAFNISTASNALGNIAFGAAWTGGAYSFIQNVNATYNGNNIFGGTGTQAQYRLCRLSLSNKSTTNRIIGVYWSQSLSGAKDGRLQAPAIVTNSILQDTNAWYIIPGQQGSQPVDMCAIFHPNANISPYGIKDAAANPSELVKLYKAGYLLFDLNGCYNSADFAGATSSNWGAAAGLKYRKAQLEWVRSNILGTKNLFLVGQSMGVMNSLAFYRQYPGIARGIVGISGAIDLSDSYSNRGFSTIIQNGYATWYLNIQAATGIDPAQQVTVSATAAAAATTITVSALSATIPTGTTIKLLSGTGDATVVTTAQANSGATSIAVTALTTGITSGAKYDMSNYWTRISYGYGAPDDVYYNSPYVWKNVYAGATAYSVNDIICKVPASVAVANYKWADPSLQYDVYKNVPIKLSHGDADTTIPIAQMTNFATNVNNAGGSVTTNTVAGGTHLSASMYDGTAIVNFLNSLK